MKRYYDLSFQEKLTLDSESFSQAVRIEAIHRGLKPPISFDELLNQGTYPSFTLPAERTAFYEIVRPGSYREERTGMCFKTQAEAESALKGCYSVSRDYNGVAEIHQGSWSVQTVYLTQPHVARKAKTVDEYTQDNSQFFALLDECEKDLQSARQSDYDRKVAAAKREEYLRLAGGQEEIAKSFWAKTESIPWPQDEQPINS